MTIELEMLAWTSILTTFMWLPYIIARIAQVGLLKVLNYTGDMTVLPDWAERAKKAHYNSIENLISFAALILIAHSVELSNQVTETAASAYFYLRITHYIVYISGLPFARTLTFAGSWMAQMCIAYQIVFSF